MIWNPWRRIRELETRLGQVACECAALNQALGQANDRYEKIREMNLQLRDTLTLYRNEAK